MKNNVLLSPNVQSIVLSISLHVLIVGLAYCIRSVPVVGISSGPAYSIALQATLPYIAKNDLISEDQTDQQGQVGNALKNNSPTIANNNSLKHSSSHSQCVSQNKRANPEKRQKIAKPYKAAVIDERGLYKTGQNGTKQTGASLELKGWEWDVVPHPNDTTEECGKIVFEIKVDKNGEIISIQTIEKTVTPIVEKIYADALRSLTFSKTADYTSTISTGKVTFILIAK